MFFSFPDNPSIGTVPSLKEYLARIAPLQDADAKSFFLSLSEPHKCVTHRHWLDEILQLMADAGLDTDIFKQYSTHSALAVWIGKTLKLSVTQICKMTS